MQHIATLSPDEVPVTDIIGTYLVSDSVQGDLTSDATCEAAEPATDLFNDEPDRATTDAVTELVHIRDSINQGYELQSQTNEENIYAVLTMK